MKCVGHLIQNLLHTCFYGILSVITSLISYLCHFNLVYKFTPSFLKINFNIILR